MSRSALFCVPNEFLVSGVSPDGVERDAPTVDRQGALPWMIAPFGRRRVS